MVDVSLPLSLPFLSDANKNIFKKKEKEPLSVCLSTKAAWAAQGPGGIWPACPLPGGWLCRRRPSAHAPSGAAPACPSPEAWRCLSIAGPPLLGGRNRAPALSPAPPGRPPPPWPCPLHLPVCVLEGGQKEPWGGFVSWRGRAGGRGSGGGCQAHSGLREGGAPASSPWSLCSRGCSWPSAGRPPPRNARGPQDACVPLPPPKADPLLCTLGPDPLRPRASGGFRGRAWRLARGLARSLPAGSGGMRA